MQCDSCQVANVNGIRCHEHGCSNAWKDYKCECFECGCDFTPSFKYQSLCDECIAEREDYLTTEEN